MQVLQDNAIQWILPWHEIFCQKALQGAFGSFASAISPKQVEQNTPLSAAICVSNKAPCFAHVHFFQDLFSRLTVLLRFDPCCMFVVSIIMAPDLIRIESYHSETLTLGATKTWAQLNHLNTSGYLIRIYLLIFQ